MKLDKAELVALFVESLLYGISCSVSIGSLWFLLFDKTRSRVRVDVKRVFVGTVVLLWLLSTVHLAINLDRMVEGFCNVDHGPIEYFFAVNDIKHIVKSALFITQTCLSDVAIVYRACKLFEHSTVTILLRFMVVATAVSGYGSIYVLGHAPLTTKSIFAADLVPWITVFNLVTALTTVLAAGLIIWRIWVIHREVQSIRLRPSYVYRLVSVISQSAALYACTLIALTVLYASKSNIQYIVLDALMPLTGIAFNYIILQRGLNRTQQTIDPIEFASFYMTSGESRIQSSTTNPSLPENDFKCRAMV